MKRTFRNIFILLSAISLTAFTACSSDDEETTQLNLDKVVNSYYPVLVTITSDLLAGDEPVEIEQQTLNISREGNNLRASIQILVDEEDNTTLDIDFILSSITSTSGSASVLKMTTFNFVIAEQKFDFLGDDLMMKGDGSIMTMGAYTVMIPQKINYTLHTADYSTKISVAYSFAGL